jgi:uncharacterized protein YbaR (Trm112 family)
MSAPNPEGPSGSSEGQSPAVPQDLLEILVCPLGKKPLQLEGETLVCTGCGARFQIKEGIPNMLIEDATLPEGVTSFEGLSCYSE